MSDWQSIAVWWPGGARQALRVRDERVARGYRLHVEGLAGGPESFEGPDVFAALVELRRWVEKRGGRVLCAGARLDVYASGMCRDMGEGRMAYVLDGKQAAGEAPKLIGVFVPAELKQVGTVEEQRERFVGERSAGQEQGGESGRLCSHGQTSAPVRARLVLVPGMGADERMFRPQRGAKAEAAGLCGIATAKWLTPERGEGLPHYAERLAASVRPVGEGPIVVGGVSLGGMLALEMARPLGAERVLLIGSCRSPRAISPLLVASERAGRLTPDWLLDWGRSMARIGVGRGGGIPAVDRALLGQMVREVPLEFLRWAGRAIMEWPGLEDPGVPVGHIHGSRDWVILRSRVRADVVVPGGAHVLNMSHPGEVNSWIGEQLRVAAERRGGV